MREIGSLTNRLMENRMFCDRIEVGTQATVYCYTDSHVYEVVKVINDKDLVIRQMKAIRTDKRGMSETQDYRFEPNENGSETEIRLANGKWRIVDRFDKKDEEERSGELLDLMRWHRALAMTPKQWEKYEAGKPITKLSKAINISFGIAEEYHDYSF